jgi:hypothetical protein
VRAVSALIVDYCGEVYRPEPGRPFVLGREGDLRIDDNPYLHRHFLRIDHLDGLWWLANTGTQISATLSDTGRAVQATLGPGARLPLVFPEMAVLFSAGPTTYEVEIRAEDAAFEPVQPPVEVAGDTTIGRVTFTPTQKLLIVALAEPLLRREGTGSSGVPASAAAAARLGWPLTTFNRKLDNVCDKLARTGVRGLRGDAERLATNRRARLVEHALTSRLVCKDDLALLPASGQPR